MELKTDKQAMGIFRNHGGTLRTQQAIDFGVHPRTLYRLRDVGQLVRVSRGVYRLASLPRTANPDLVVVATRIPRGVVCLVSALAYHDITSEVPHEVHIALARGSKTPRLGHPPIRVFRFSEPAFSQGICVVQVDGVAVKLYTAEKTVVDCFRFRNKLGIDVAVEALQLCIKRRGAKPVDLLHYARICRVERVMRPYLEALQ